MVEESEKAAALTRVRELVRRFDLHKEENLKSGYNETQARTDFITPLLEAFGWDVHNIKDLPQDLREVVEEATVDVGEKLSKRPDYELRLVRQRKLFVEAKKPNTSIDRDKAAAFQARQYGYSASLPIVVLTNFYQLAIYDCKQPPKKSDEAHVSRDYKLITYDKFEEEFEYLWPRLSRSSVYSGEFDNLFAIEVTRHGAEQFDDFFLRQVRSWRERLAIDIYANTPNLTPEELTYAVQLFLSRIVFLRICEDREIERYENLKNLSSTDTFNVLMGELQRADTFYDSGLFNLLGDAPLGIKISDSVLYSIITELYYPQSPYTFAVIETEVLGQIYEQFLGEVIVVTNNQVEIVEKPEVRESGAVFPTPRYIVDAIVERTLVPALREKSPSELEYLTVADICCGSGVFLLAVYEFINNHYLEWYLSNNRNYHQQTGLIYEVVAGQWRLSFEEKRRILLKHIRGVDIDPNAVEVTQFSLLLKLIENETETGLKKFNNRQHTSVLPPLASIILSGNSLVSAQEWDKALGPMKLSLIEKVFPFDWSEEFPQEMEREGFDVIVGNPPYIRIQKMTTYSPEEVSYYKNSNSPYSTAREDNFDKYALFIERSLALLRPNGRLGLIVPHKFMITKAGRALRYLINTGQFLEEIIHFGAKQVFGRSAANYTSILVFNRSGQDTLRVEKVTQLEAWRNGASGTIFEIGASTLGEDPWQFADTETQALFERIRKAFPQRLQNLADIFVALQTSKDPIYIFRAVEGNEDTVSLQWDNRNWPIERGILRPSLLDVQLVAYKPPQPNSWMIFPYELEVDDAADKIRARLIQPAEMAEQFPLCYSYLQARQSELEKRKINGGKAVERQFYQFGRSQSLTEFGSPKIILQVLSLEPRYTYDDQDIVVTGGGNGPYYMVRATDDASVSNYYLLAVLNHPLSEAFVRTNTSTFRGGYYSHGKQFIKDLPIPIPSEQNRIAIETLVAELIKTFLAMEAARIPHKKTTLERQAAILQKQIEDYISSLFGLSQADIEIVRAVPIPD